MSLCFVQREGGWEDEGKPFPESPTKGSLPGSAAAGDVELLKQGVHSTQQGKQPWFCWRKPFFFIFSLYLILLPTHSLAQVVVFFPPMFIQETNTLNLSRFFSAEAEDSQPLNKLHWCIRACRNPLLPLALERHLFFFRPTPRREHEPAFGGVFFFLPHSLSVLCSCFLRVVHLDLTQL